MELCFEHLIKALPLSPDHLCSQLEDLKASIASGGGGSAAPALNGTGLMPAAGKAALSNLTEHQLGTYQQDNRGSASGSRSHRSSLTGRVSVRTSLTGARDSSFPGSPPVLAYADALLSSSGYDDGARLSHGSSHGKQMALMRSASGRTSDFGPLLTSVSGGGGTRSGSLIPTLTSLAEGSASTMLSGITNATTSSGVSDFALTPRSNSQAALASAQHQLQILQSMASNRRASAVVASETESAEVCPPPFQSQTIHFKHHLALS